MAFGHTIIACSISHERSDSVLTPTTAKNPIIATMSSDTDALTTSCRLLELPAELRNRIWEYTMKGGKLISSPQPTPFSSPSPTNLFFLPQQTTA